jgi:hypothetical protein
MPNRLHRLILSPHLQEIANVNRLASKAAKAAARRSVASALLLKEAFTYQADSYMETVSGFSASYRKIEVRKTPAYRFRLF